MPINSLTIGPVHTLIGPRTVPIVLPAVIYALPARKTLVTVQPATTNSISVSNDQVDWNPVPLVGTNYQFEVSAAFIRSNLSDNESLIKLAGD